MGNRSGPLDFFLGEPGGQNADPVSSDAFSLTKVLITATGILTPLTTALVDGFSKVNFTSGQFVALTLGVLAFAAIASAADVLARALATWGSSRDGYVQFDTKWSAKLKPEKPSDDPTDVQIVAARVFGVSTQFLVIKDSGAQWVEMSALDLT
jgi:hypothetical protein